MNRNPSTISWQIRQLEQELGVVLFDRYKKSLRITPEGERLLAWTISTFELLRGMKSDVSSPSGVLRGTVSVSSNLPFSAHVVGVVSAFRKAHPEVRIKIRRALTYEVVDDVASSRVDFGLTGMTAESSNCELEELFTSRPCSSSRPATSSACPNGRRRTISVVCRSFPSWRKTWRSGAIRISTPPCAPCRGR